MFLSNSRSYSRSARPDRKGGGSGGRRSVYSPLSLLRSSPWSLVGDSRRRLSVLLPVEACRCRGDSRGVEIREFAGHSLEFSIVLVLIAHH